MLLLTSYKFVLLIVAHLDKKPGRWVMRRIPIDHAKPGMINARHIYSAEGRTLLAAGIALNEYYISRLKELGVHSLYIRDETTEDLNIPEVVSERTRLETVKTVRQIFHSLESNRNINTRAVRTAVDNILDEILTNTDILVQLSDIRSYDDYNFYHSVNVCILSLMTGVSLGMNTLQLRDLGVGALLHDVGKIKVPESILNKPGPLTPSEFEEVKKHTIYGFDILRQYPDISLLSSHVAFQHHERIDGSGYPRGLKESEIHEYARIVAVTDVYDALLADRVYRKALIPYQAIQIITRGTYTFFDPRIVGAFLENIAIYPVGSLVQLNTGDIGFVVDVNKKSPHKPVIRRLLDHHGQKVKAPQEIDLDKLHTVYIVKVFNEELSYSLLQEIENGKFK